MAEIKIKKVLKVSSQDQVFKAENLTTGQEDAKWIGAKDGETKQSVTFELEKATKIHQITVQNESSAFIEIRVGSETAESEEDDFEVLLSAMALMTPSESKNRLNANRLKTFTSEMDLDKDIAQKLSKRVHIICTQPFNTNIQFGFSDIKIYDKVLTSPESTDLTKIKAGGFALKKEIATPSQETAGDIAAGSFFKKSKEREKVADEEPSTSKTPTPAKPGYFLNLKAKASSESEDEKENKKTPANGNARVKAEKPGPALKGVVFALSGFQNPERSEIRDQGLKLGAKYRPDWTKECTHLICAFTNTPKASQARKEGGKIVTKDWLASCAKAQKLLKEDGYELSNPDTDSDDETRPRKAAKKATKKLSRMKDEDESDEEEEEVEDEDDKDFIVESSEEEEEMELDRESSEEESESLDSDDSERATKKKKKKKAKIDKEDAKKKKKPSKPKKADSSDEQEAPAKSEDWELPTFFEGKQFFVYGDFGERKLREIKRQIVAFEGTLNVNLSEETDYVITDKKWEDDFEKAKEESKKLVIVNEDWLHACTRRKKLVAHQPYEVKQE